MNAVLQRVQQASVTIEGLQTALIRSGLLVLLGIRHDDTEEDVEWLVSKIIQMRLFADESGKMNLSLQDIGGELLLVSQFTLLASTKKGNRPSFTEAAKPETAIPLYQKAIDRFTEKLGKPIQTGTFGADMQISLINDGPVTIWIDTKNKR